MCFVFHGSISFLPFKPFFFPPLVSLEINSFPIFNKISNLSYRFDLIPLTKRQIKIRVGIKDRKWKLMLLSLFSSWVFLFRVFGFFGWLNKLLENQPLDDWEMWGSCKVGVLGVVMWVSWLSFCCRTSADVVLIGRNITLSFSSVDAYFAPTAKASGERGTLFVGEPLDACTQLIDDAQHKSNCSSAFVLVVRGGCSFENKVRIAQEAGFKAAVVYNNEVDGPLVAMSGSSVGINIHAVFVSRPSGELLKKYAGSTDVELWIIPSNENSAWSIMAISFISLLAMSAVLATCFFVRRHRIRRERPQAPRVREFHGMSHRLVKAMPSLVFTSVVEDNCTSQTCAICLEDYNIGEKLRILPCRHQFHALCVDAWLTSWRTFCPVCKRDARTATGEPPASESTPLLSSTPTSVASSPVLSSSARSSSSASPAIRITRASLPPSASHASSLASTYAQHSLHSYRQSPSVMSVSRSSVDLRNAFSQRSQGSSHLVSPLSVALAYPSISPINSCYMSYAPSPSNASASYLGYSYLQNPLHYSESTASFSPFASAYSLPEC